MPKVTYVGADGVRRDVEVAIGDTLMRGATDNNVPGIDGDCGGACACATCHIQVDEMWRGRVGDVTPGSQESEMMQMAADVFPSSRLGCQIVMTADLDGLVVHVPAAQH